MQSERQDNYKVNREMRGHGCVPKPPPLDVAVLCGGMGTRLRGTSGGLPKPLVDVGGRPFLVWLLHHLSKWGFGRFVLCTGYHADAFASYFGTRSWPFKVLCSPEPEPLGTAGGLWHARSHLHSNPVIVLNGDSFCNVDYGKMLDFHTISGALATIAAVRVDDARDYGTIETAGDGRLRTFREKDAGIGAGLINGGVYVVSSEMLDRPLPRSVCSLEREVFPSLAGGPVFAFQCCGPLVDIGTPERLEQARRKIPQLLSFPV